MAKRKIIRKSNKPFTYNPNYYAWGGDFKNALGGTKLSGLKDIFSGGNVAEMLKGGLASGIGNTVGDIAGGAISGGVESGIGNSINKIGSTIGGIVGTANPILGGVISAGTGILGGVTNALFGSKLNQEKIDEIDRANVGMNTILVDSNDFDTIANQWSNQTFGEDFTKSDIGKDGLFSNKAKNKYKELKRQQEISRNRALAAYMGATESADRQMDLDVLSNFAAFGGPINTFSGGGEIYIKPENRGKFTKYCGGKVTSECIAKGKRSSNPAVRKRATFAANVRKWHHAFGGNLLTHGAEWDNGLRIIGNGGTHEENPMEGVPMGMDAEGNPNLVEQGEVIFNDYVFSNRMFADGGLLESFNLPKSYDGYSFAAIAEKLGEESKERPNDPISKRGLLSSMSRLQQAQETVRQQNQVGQEGVQYAHGGRMGTLFDGLGDTPNFLDGVDYGDWQDYGTLLEPINAEDLWNESMAGADEGDKGNNNSKLTWLRYAPVVGAAIGLGQNLFSKPDYTSADAILEAANQAGNYTPVGYTPIGNYLQYRPFDRNFYLNKLNAQAGATRRAIMNTTSPSRNAALLAADYNAQGRLGDLARQAEEYNLAQRQAVETFNRGTNMANAEMGLKAAMANQEAALKARSSRLSGVAQAMAVRDAVDARRGASMSANLTNFFNSLGDIGREEVMKAWINENPALYYAISTGGAGTPYKGKKKEDKKAKGGYLTIKSKRK